MDFDTQLREILEAFQAEVRDFWVEDGIEATKKDLDL